MKKYIYTKKGYNLQCTLYVRGISEKKCRLSIRTVKGAFDDELRWPMRDRIKYVLIGNEGNEDQERTIYPSIENQKGSFDKPPHKNDGLEKKLVSHDELNNFLSNGTLTLKIMAAD